MSAPASAPEPAGAAGGMGAGYGYAAPTEGATLGLDLQQGVQSVAQAADVGELFRYQIATPVELARGKSAMLPIVNQSVEGDKVSIYNDRVHAARPLHGLKIKNKTKQALMSGPVTVYD